MLIRGLRASTTAATRRSLATSSSGFLFEKGTTLFGLDLRTLSIDWATALLPAGFPLFKKELSPIGELWRDDDVRSGILWSQGISRINLDLDDPSVICRIRNK